MKKALFLVLGLSLFFCSNSFAQDLTANDIVAKADMYRGSMSWSCKLKVVDFKTVEGKAKVESEDNMDLNSKLLETKIKSLCLFTSETNKGEKMLMDGSVYWYYTPGTKNIVRITPQQRIAGQATASDIASTNFSHEYDAVFAKDKEENVLKKFDCFKLELTAKKDIEVAYAKLVYWVEKTTFKPIKVQYYSVAGKHLKSAYYRDFKMVEAVKHERAHELFIVDPLEKGHVTRMLWSDYVLFDHPDLIFRKANLNK